MSEVKRYWGAALVLALVCGAAQAGDERKTADIQVWAIRATTKNTEISPELKGLAEKLKQQFKYTGFKLEKRSGGKTDVGKTFTATLLGEYSAKVTLRKHDGKRVELQIEVLKDKSPALKTTVTLPVGESQLMGGWKLNDTDALIAAVAAR